MGQERDRPMKKLVRTQAPGIVVTPGDRQQLLRPDPGASTLKGMMRRPHVLALGLAAVLGAARPLQAGGPVKGTVKESARTGGHAARDGAQTFGRTVRDFFTKGPRAAKRTWKENAARTKANARAGGKRVRAAADAD
jgi:hypothetical protein